ncbi:hypothetical protein D8674_037633 [Pyrus ussuriensis x Pyrus communis]|uniref:Uncharacterized protein n=1 Tax=Pyrus ussuriensis x Pyrus communis TaxID=2448454 RepID=A0A5N5GZ00_9ROSA|nr:hypothetical protein D8674_037633 [Pyrus ussuriensis x Pyrus communis]
MRVVEHKSAWLGVVEHKSARLGIVVQDRRGWDPRSRHCHVWELQSKVGMAGTRDARWTQSRTGRHDRELRS